MGLDHVDFVALFFFFSFFDFFFFVFPRSGCWFGKMEGVGRMGLLVGC